MVTQLVEGETVLVHLQTNEIYALNRTATRAWNLLVSGKEYGAIREQLDAEFDAPRHEIDQNLASLVSDLLDRKLVRSAQ